MSGVGWGQRQVSQPGTPLWRDSGFKQLLMNGCSYFRFGGSLKLENKMLVTCRGVRREEERQAHFPPLCLVPLFGEAQRLESKSTLR